MNSKTTNHDKPPLSEGSLPPLVSYMGGLRAADRPPHPWETWQSAHCQAVHRGLLEAPLPSRHATSCPGLATLLLAAFQGVVPGHASVAQEVVPGLCLQVVINTWSGPGVPWGALDIPWEPCKEEFI